MFDIGFSELLVVFVVGLLILGPERLPHAAKTAGLWVRKVRRSIHSVQREINAQLDQEELQQKVSKTNFRTLEDEKETQKDTTPLSESHTEKVHEEDPIMKPIIKDVAENPNVLSSSEHDTENTSPPPIAPKT